MLKYIWNFINSILGILILTIFFFEIPLVPTESMKPTIYEGDIFLASKSSYGYNSFSATHFNMAIRFVTNSNPRLFNYHFEISAPQRGDIIEFAYVPEELKNTLANFFNRNSNKQVYYCKRIIAIPGDTIEIKNDIIYLNNVPLSRKYIGISTFNRLNLIPFEAAEFKESLNGKEYSTIYDVNNQSHDKSNYPPYTLKENEYFVMGDNRNNSNDSRFIGPIKKNQIVGKLIYKVGDFNMPTWFYNALDLLPFPLLKYVLMNPIGWLVLFSFILRGRALLITTLLILLYILYIILTTCGPII